MRVAHVVERDHVLDARDVDDARQVGEDRAETGQRVMVAVNISPRSTDIVAGRNQPQGADNHGTLVSSVIAAPFNNFGTVGIAFNSTILSIRADVSECTKPEDTVCFRGPDLANALDYAVANGAKIINLSLGGEGALGSSFEAALLRAINAGVVFAIASGNEAGANPEWPGRYASDPRFAGGIIDRFTQQDVLPHTIDAHQLGVTARHQQSHKRKFGWVST